MSSPLRLSYIKTSKTLKTSSTYQKLYRNSNNLDGIGWHRSYEKQRVRASFRVFIRSSLFYVWLSFFSSSPSSSYYYYFSCSFAFFSHFYSSFNKYTHAHTLHMRLVIHIGRHTCRTIENILRLQFLWLFVHSWKMQLHSGCIVNFGVNI